MRHGSLFSGIGGFDLAAEWMGWENIFHCEWNEFGQKILKHYWPNAISYGDITTTDFNVHRGQIDIITGGFPCQPYSTAGERKGREDNRHLWPEMLRAVREIQPYWIVGENVPGLVNWGKGMVFKEIKSDLESEGFTVIPPVLLPAAAIGADHYRERIWIIAHANGKRSQENGKGYGQIRSILPKASTQFMRPDAVAKLLGPRNSGRIRSCNGIPNRLDRIKALGNAIVPQIAFELFKAIEKTIEYGEL